MQKKIYSVPEKIDLKIANLSLKHLGIKIDKLTQLQEICQVLLTDIGLSRIQHY
jgi:S-adenosylhomocysteine hydrolase